MKSELFLIEVRADATDDWLALEVSPHPYAIPGGEADQLIQAGALYRWRLVRSSR